MARSKFLKTSPAPLTSCSALVVNSFSDLLISRSGPEKLSTSSATILSCSSGIASSVVFAVGRVLLDHLVSPIQVTCDFRERLAHEGVGMQAVILCQPVGRDYRRLPRSGR